MIIGLSFTSPDKLLELTHVCMNIKQRMVKLNPFNSCRVTQLVKKMLSEKINNMSCCPASNHFMLSSIKYEYGYKV